MKRNFKQQEVLLVTKSRFAKRICIGIEKDGNNGSTSLDQLTEACWNGLLFEILPELLENSTEGKELYLWHVRQGESFLHAEYSEEAFSTIDHFMSIDPYFFLPGNYEN